MVQEVWVCIKDIFKRLATTETRCTSLELRVKKLEDYIQTMNSYWWENYTRDQEPREVEHYDR